MDNVEEKLLKKSKILQSACRIAEKRGEEVHLVGGAIRDLLLGKPLGKDFDFVTQADAGVLAKAMAGEMRGHVFPLDETLGTWRVVLKKGKRKFEIDFSSMQGKNIFEDLRQRDFTINSMAIPLKKLFHQGSPSLIDPLAGVSDLRQKIIRANSEESLRHDPLRMLRAFRFSSTLGLKLEEKTLRMIQENKELILRSAGERIRSELFAAFDQTQAGRFLRDLYRSGLLTQIIPEVQGWETLDQGTHHDFPLLEHAFKTVEAAEFILAHLADIYPAYASPLDNHFTEIMEEGINRQALFKFAAYFHDSGKPGTRSVDPAGPSCRFLDHDLKGQKINASIARRIKLSRKSIRILSELTRHHMRILSLSKGQRLTPRAKYRFFRDLGKEGIDQALLALADGLASKKIDFLWTKFQNLPGDLGKIKEVAGELICYYHEEFSRKPQKPLLDGREIMEAFGLPQGKAVGNLLAQLREAELAGMVRSREEAIEFLKNIDRSRPLG
ncbi:MAG: hypothetical protein QME78_12975 [Thermodesulfobacteriota bacterium]|nr:hypothetical protein [Thermodesulfobacteriota bacterium]